MRQRHVLTWCALLLAAVVVLSSCSGSDETGDADGTADPTTPAEVPATEPSPSAGPLERYAGQESEVYADLANWVCHPDAQDVCDDGLDATSIEADGTLTEQRWEPAEAPIDRLLLRVPDDLAGPRGDQRSGAR